MLKINVVIVSKRPCDFPVRDQPRCVCGQIKVQSSPIRGCGDQRQAQVESAVIADGGRQLYPPQHGS